MKFFVVRKADIINIYLYMSAGTKSIFVEQGAVADIYCYIYSHCIKVFFICKLIILQ